MKDYLVSWFMGGGVLFLVIGFAFGVLLVVAS